MNVDGSTGALNHAKSQFLALVFHEQSEDLVFIILYR